MSIWKCATVAAALAFTFAVPMASASSVADEFGPNLVNNPGFETGDFTGWTPGGNFGFNGVTCPGPSSIVHSGNCAGFFGPVGTPGTLSQDVATTAGQDYNIDFWLQAIGDVPSLFEVSFNGVTLLSLNNPSTGGAYSLFVEDPVASGPLTTLEFTFRDDPGFLFLDDVSVRAVSAVPEPASLLLVGLGLAALGFRRRSGKG